MKKFYVLFLVAGLVFAGVACGGSSDESDDTEEVTEEEEEDDSLISMDDMEGQKVYTNVCGVCHGTDGALQAAGAFDLTASTLSLEEKIEVITNGRNAMMAYKATLSEDEIKAVAEYTMKFSKK